MASESSDISLDISEESSIENNKIETKNNIEDEEKIRIIKSAEDLEHLDEVIYNVEQMELEKDIAEFKDELKKPLAKPEELEEAQSSDSSITIFSDVEESDHMNVDNDNDEHETLGYTTVHGIETEITVSKTKTEVDEAEMHKRAEKAVCNQVKKMKNEAATIADDFVFDLDEYSKDSQNYTNAKLLLNAPLFIPNECVENEERQSLKDLEKKYISLDSFVDVITHIEGYSWKNMPNEKMLHTFAENFVVCKRMKHIFKYDFADVNGTDFRLASITDKLFTFLGKYAELDDLRFEHMLVVCLLGKIEIILNTERNIWLKADLITVDDAILKVFKPEILEMKNLQTEAPNHHMAKSWNALIESLFNLKGRKNLCFDIKQRGYRVLNEVLKSAYCYHRNDGQPAVVNYVMEELVGNTLKMYNNSVVQSLFFAIRTIYILARLISIYVQTADVPADAKSIANDLKVIAAFAIMTYEVKYQLWKESPRVPTKLVGGEELGAQAQLFVNNYVITGGQYFFLKAVERAIPTIAYDLAKR